MILSRVACSTANHAWARSWSATSANETSGDRGGRARGAVWAELHGGVVCREHVTVKHPVQRRPALIVGIKQTSQFGRRTPGAGHGRRTDLATARSAGMLG